MAAAIAKEAKVVFIEPPIVRASPTLVISRRKAGQVELFAEASNRLGAYRIL
jgi:hypothetical protein